MHLFLFGITTNLKSGGIAMLSTLGNFYHHPRLHRVQILISRNTEKHIDSTTNDLNDKRGAHIMVDPCSTSYQEESDDDDSLFEETGLDAASIYQNTYFMDGDHHFISVRKHYCIHNG